MKNLIFLLLAGFLLFASPPETKAQTCNISALLNCDSTLTISIPVNPGVVQYQVYIAGGAGTVQNMNVAANASGVTTFNSVAISPSTSQYTITVGRITGLSPVTSLYPCNPINIIWTQYNADGSATGVPAKLGYTYPSNGAPTQTVTCASQSAASFITVKKKGKGH